MPGRMYTAQFPAVTVTAQQDFFEITAAATQVILIHEWELTQSTEVGDAMEEGLQLLTKRGVGATTSGTGGTTLTAQPISDGDAAFGGVVEANNTTKMVAGGGSIEQTASYNWNVRVPYIKTYTPETRPQIIPSARWTLELATTPADSISISGTITFEVLGGA